MNEHIKTILKILGVILLFTGIDFIFHYFIPYLHVPQPSYSWNKLWIGTILGILGYYFLKWFNYAIELSPYLNASIFSLLVILLLQLRYAFIYSYGVIWNVIVLVLHYLILAPLSYFILDWDFDD